MHKGNEDETVTESSWKTYEEYNLQKDISQYS